MLKENSDVKWTFVLMHKPLLKREHETGFKLFETALAGRKYKLSHYTHSRHEHYSSKIEVKDIVSMKYYSKYGLLTLAIALAILSIPALATKKESKQNNQSGYSEAPSLAGASSVTKKLYENDKDRPSIYQFDNLQTNFKSYFDWKRKINTEYNLSFGLSAYWLYQQADKSANDDTNAGGGVYRFQGNWQAFTFSDGSTGSLNWRVENRSELGGLQSPATLGGAIAGGFNTGFGYSDNFSTDLAVLNWTQGFNGDKAGVAVGRLAFDAYLDAFAFQTFSRGFINRAFILNTTMGTTGIGALGAVVKGYVSNNIWLGAHIYDANASSGKFDFDTVQEGEYLTAVELGWTPSAARQKTDRIQLTYWQKDQRALAATSKGSGWLLSASYLINESVLPFVRYGNSDGGADVAATQSLSAGVDIKTSPTQNLTMGIAWNELNDNTSEINRTSEWVVETSYKFQLSKNFSFTPDLQLMKNPASLASQSDNNWIFGIRGILTL